MNYAHHYHSPLGGITAVSEGGALVGLWFDGQKNCAVAPDSACEEKDLPVFRRTDEWLDIYFSGRDPGFTPPLLMRTTEFRAAVWRILLTIPFGATTTYGEIADRIAKEKGVKKISAQAVGNAVGHNPFPLMIPCHRVVGANGNLTGYAGGIERKRKLLEMEGVDASTFFDRKTAIRRDNFRQ